jgi:hypothetical protein
LCEKTVKNGGETKREWPENLIKSGEEDWNKWSAVKCNTSWCMLEFKETIYF